MPKPTWSVLLNSVVFTDVCVFDPGVYVIMHWHIKMFQLYLFKTGIHLLIM